MAKPQQGGRGGRGKFEDKEFDQRILELARVTRVTKGGKRMRFRACVIIGDRKGRVGYGLAKGLDVQQSVQKAATQAKKRLVTVPLQNGTIPHAVHMKFAAAKIVIKPAPIGTGIKAGGAVRVVLELAGVPNAVAKILGSNNKINNTKATINALKQLKPALKKMPKSEAVEAAPVVA
jgi:small subunit ribosomal protein S5